MTQVERIRDVCKKQGIAIKKLENDLKFGHDLTAHQLRHGFATMRCQIGKGKKTAETL